MDKEDFCLSLEYMKLIHVSGVTGVQEQWIQEAPGSIPDDDGNDEWRCSCRGATVFVTVDKFRGVVWDEHAEQKDQEDIEE
jgi:hypothetical protein